MKTTTALGVTFYTQVCCHKDCCISFAVPNDFDDARRADHGFFFCPRGHSQHYAGKSDLERANDAARYERERADRATARAEMERSAKESAIRSARATRGHFNRVKARVASGVCPCCKRSFQNLGRHMGGQHPEWGKVEK